MGRPRNEENKYVNNTVFLDEIQRQKIINYALKLNLTLTEAVRVAIFQAIANQLTIPKKEKAPKNGFQLRLTQETDKHIRDLCRRNKVNKQELLAVIIDKFMA